MVDVVDLLDQAGIHHKDRGTDVGREHVNISCPFHGEIEPRMHLGIHLDLRVFHCWVCGESGGWRKLANKLREIAPSVDWNGLKPPRFRDVYVDDETPLSRELVGLTRDFDTYHWQGMTDRDSAAWEFLCLERGFEPDLIKTIRPGIGLRDRAQNLDLRGAVTFTQGGNLIARRFNGFGAPWWKSTSAPFVFGETWMTSLAPSWVVLCEGVFDALSAPLGNGIAVLGSVRSDAWLGEFSARAPADLRKVVVCFDANVKRAMINSIRLELRDVGFDPVLWDWSAPDLDEPKRLIAREWRDDPEADLDRVRLVMGRDWVHEKLLRLAGILPDATDSDPLL